MADDSQGWSASIHHAAGDQFGLYFALKERVSGAVWDESFTTTQSGFRFSGKKSPST
jgi:hypothetical protein